MILMNREFSSSIKGKNIVSIHDYSPGKGIHYGLIILLELETNYYSGGCELIYICQKNEFSLCAVTPIMHKLKEIGLIGCRMDNPDWWFLKEEPHRKWILEVVSALKGIFYPNNSNGDL